MVSAVVEGAGVEASLRSQHDKLRGNAQYLQVLYWRFTGVLLVQKRKYWRKGEAQEPARLAQRQRPVSPGAQCTCFTGTKVLALRAQKLGIPYEKLRSNAQYLQVLYWRFTGPSG